MTYTIGIDYGLSNNDIPIYTVMTKQNEALRVIDSGKIEDFNYENYIASEHQIAGCSEDLKRFKDQFAK